MGIKTAKEIRKAVEEKNVKQRIRKERNHFMTPHNYRYVKEVHRDGWLKQKDTGEVTGDGKGVCKGMESWRWKSFCHSENLL